MIEINGVRFEKIKHSQQRYDTAGDWFYDKANNLVIRVSELGDWRYELLVALHEFIEAVLCNYNEVSEAQVTAFDLEHLLDDEPGANKESPYHKEHTTATLMEKFLANFLQVNWEKYDEAIQKLAYCTDAT